MAERMTERQIIFSVPMVRAILDGRKTQTRRVIKIIGVSGKKVSITSPDERLIELEPGEFQAGVFHYLSTGGLSGPYRLPWKRGDTLWVKEAYAYGWPMNVGDVVPPSPPANAVAITYKETGKVPFGNTGKWRSPIFMPRWASRITLKVTDVRVQRLQDISEEDAEAEGVSPLYAAGWPSREHIGGFRKIWWEIHGPGSWEANPWVAAITFERVKP